MKAKVGMKYMLIDAERFGSIITADNGQVWRPEIQIVEFVRIDRSTKELGVLFDTGGHETYKFEFTDANDMLSFNGRRWILLTPAFFKTEEKENT